MPEISMIVPVYNVEQYLPAALDSLRAQTCPDWEAILVDDGSPDGCGALCDAAARQDARFRVIHQKNAGVGAARNAGLAAARGTRKYRTSRHGRKKIRKLALLNTMTLSPLLKMSKKNPVSFLTGRIRHLLDRCGCGRRSSDDSRISCCGYCSIRKGKVKHLHKFLKYLLTSHGNPGRIISANTRQVHTSSRVVEGTAR